MYCENNPLRYVDPTGLYTVREVVASIFDINGATTVNNNATKAISYAIVNQSILGGGLHNGPADAFRHAYWMALNARDIGDMRAKQFGDAHEAELKQPDSEREMDLHNNEVGRNIGTANPNATDAELAKLVEAALKNNELITNCTPNNNTYNYGEGVNNYNNITLQPNSLTSPISTPTP